MGNKWIPVKERKPDCSYRNILVKLKDGTVGFAYHWRYLPKEFGDEILPREEFLEKCEQVFTGIPVRDINDISILKKYNTDDIEYWMNLEDAVDKEKWKPVDQPFEYGPCENVLVINSDSEIKVGRMIVYREMTPLSSTPINGAVARGKRYRVFHTKYCGHHEDLMFLVREDNVVSWQYLPEA